MAPLSKMVVIYDTFASGIEAEPAITSDREMAFQLMIIAKAVRGRHGLVTQRFSIGATRCERAAGGGTSGLARFSAIGSRAGWRIKLWDRCHQHART